MYKGGGNERGSWKVECVANTAEIPDEVVT